MSVSNFDRRFDSPHRLTKDSVDIGTRNIPVLDSYPRMLNNALRATSKGKSYVGRGAGWKQSAPELIPRLFLAEKRLDVTCRRAEVRSLVRT